MAGRQLSKQTREGINSAITHFDMGMDELRAVVDGADDKEMTDNQRLLRRLMQTKAVDLSLPSYMIANLRRGLKLHEEGRSGDGLKPQTVREARQMVESGTITPDKQVRASAWLARHASDKVPN